MVWWGPVVGPGQWETTTDQPTADVLVVLQWVEVLVLRFQVETFKNL